MENRCVINIITQMEAGGAQGAAVRATEELRKRGYDAETCFLYMKSPTYVNHENIHIVLNRRPKGVLDYIRIFYNLVRYLKKKKPIAVITFTHYANIMGQLAAFLCGVKARVASQRNPVYTYPRGARYLDKVLGSIGLYTKNIVVSKAVQDSVDNYPNSYRKRLKLIYNGIPINKLVLEKERAREKFNIPINCKLAINVGRLAEQKNQIMLVHLLKHVPDLHVAIAGEGHLRDLLESEAKSLGVEERLHLVGEIPPKEIPQFLSTGDIFVFPSKFEAFGFAMVEAMVAGLPIIASDIPALREVLGGLEGKPSGILVSPEDLQGFVKAVKSVFEEKKLAESLSLDAKKRAEVFSLKRMMDGYEACFVETLQRVSDRY